MIVAIMTTALSGTAWAEKITDYSNIVSGTQYYIGATTGGTDYYLSVNGSSTSTSIAGTAVTAKANATPFTFAGSGTSWTIQFESGYYLSLKSTKDNGKVQVVESAATFTASNQSGKIRLTIGSYSVQKNNSGTQFGSYGNTQTDIWLEEASTTPAYTITAQSNNNSYGTVSLSGTTITATPEDGYRVSTTTPYTVTSGTATVAQNGNSFEVTASSDCTITINFEAIPTVSGYTIDFENDVDAYVDWEFENIGTSNTAITAHGGSKYGANINDAGNGVSTASIQTKEAVALPGTITCYVSKTSNNTTTSTWKVQVSSDGSTWTDVSSQDATSMSKGTWVEFTANLSGYSDVYVRLSYGSSNAIRAIDDISITMRDPNTKITPTITIDATGLTADLAGSTNVSAGNITATVTSGETNITTPAVTWSSSDTGVATVNASTGAVTLIAVGTTTITASFAGNDDYTEAADTYELTVINTYAKGQVNNPYTVAEAIDAIDNDGNVTDVYVRGIVCTGGSSLSSGALTYWISDDGTETDKFEIYRGKGISNANFTSTDDIQVGDVVVVRGNITLYNNSTTYEFSSGSQLVSLSRKNDSDLAAIGNINLSMASPETTADATAYFTTSSTGAISYESGNTSVATVNAAGVVTPVAAGTTTITVTQAADADYKAGEITINVIVAVASLNSTTIAANASGSTTYGTPKEESYMIDETYDGTIAAVSSNPAVATVAIIQHTAGEGTFTITPVAVGTAVITISAPATATCEAATDVTYTITVNAPAGQTTAAAAAVTLFNETFAGCTSTGGNDTDGWSGQIATGTLTDGTCTDNSGWTFANGNAANGCAKFGSGSKKGSATTPAIGTAGTLILSFKAAAWNGGTEGTTLKLSVSEGSIDKSSVTMTKGAFDTFTATITNATAETTITFEAQNASNNRFFLDDVKVTTEGAELTAKLNDSGYATYCSQYPLDFSDYATAGYSAWQITGVSGETITFSQITGSIMGGQGILLKGTAGKTIELTSANSSTTLSGNLLEGTLAPKYVAADEYYGLSGNEFVKVNAGTVPAGKALLPANALGSNVKAFTFVFEDDATGIEETLSNSPLKGENIYNLAGQMVNGKSVNGKLPKGIYIVNGKKVMVK